MRNRLLAVLIAGITLGLAACGGASREDFANEANAICRDVERDIEQINRGEVTNVAEANRFLRREYRAGWSL